MPGSASGDILYKYVGILHIKNPQDFSEKDAKSPQCQGFFKKWRAMVTDPHVLV
jgi:hypothetical protein